MASRSMATKGGPKGFQFQHEPLDQSSNAIRVVQVLPSSTEDLLECQITHTILSDKYTAVSYMWGPSDRLRTILVNNRSFLIRYNLWHFLNVMRQQQATLELWIDALCINQPRDSLFDVICGNVPSDKSRIELHHQVRGKSKLRQEHRPKWLPRVLDFCSNPYWKRLWVIQEITLAQAIDVYWGCKTVDAAALAAFLSMLLDLLTTSVSSRIVKKEAVPVPISTVARSDARL